MNIRAIQARDAAKDYKSRKGGISDDAFKDLNKEEKKEWKDAGYISNAAVGFAANSYERDKYNDKRKRFEEAAYEHGYGNIETGDQAKDFMKGYKEVGSNLNSYSDVRQFRRAHNDFDSKRFEDIESRLDKQSSAPKPQVEPEKPKQEEPEAVTHSPEFAQANATVAAHERPNIWSQETTGLSKPSTTASPTPSNQGNFSNSFMHRYKAGVKDSLQPTKPTGEDDEAPSSKPSWQTWQGIIDISTDYY